MDSFMTWGAFSALLIFASGSYYMWGIVSGEIKRPIMSTWFIWSIIGLIFLLSYYEAGAKLDTTLPAAWMGFINPLIIFLLALKYGQKGWTQLDTWCIAVCAVGVISWQLSKSPMVGLLSAIVADSMGAIPQIRKSWTDPDDEPWFPWTCFCVGSGINILALESWALEHSLYPLYMTIGSLLICIPIVWRTTTRKIP